MIACAQTMSARFFPHVLLSICFGALGACSNGNGDNDQRGVPGSNTDDVVTVTAAQVSSPIAGAPTLVSTFFSLPSLGYEQAEYFIEGTARAYVNVNELQSDGRWQVEEADQAGYRTRVVVNRPSDPSQFNGTVLVEWLNVSAGFDSAPDWGMLHTELIRSGYAWVGISAQQVGVDALIDGSASAVVPGGTADGRYDTLSHPGDPFAYSIFSQFAQALREPGASGLLGDLEPQHLIAAGESQSAGFLLTYVNALAPRHALFDGYFIHSRTQGSAPLQGTFFEADIPTPEVVRVRDDLGVPTLMLQTETDLFVLGSYPSNQEDSDNFRLWEVAGTAHADLYTFLDNRLDIGANPAVAAIVENKAPIPGIIECEIPVNAGPQHFVAKAAVHALNEWITQGTPAPSANRLEVAGAPPMFVTDEFGNTLGGVRTPYVDAPIAILEGQGQPQPDFLNGGDDIDEISIETVDFCFLSGTTELFDTATLSSLYSSNASYRAAVNNSADDAVEKGFLLAPDAELIKASAAATDLFGN